VVSLQDHVLEYWSEKGGTYVELILMTAALGELDRLEAHFELVHVLDLAAEVVFRLQVDLTGRSRGRLFGRGSLVLLLLILFCLFIFIFRVRRLVDFLFLHVLIHASVDLRVLCPTIFILSIWHLLVFALFVNHIGVWLAWRLFLTLWRVHL
jgi:hypothetical protein